MLIWEEEKRVNAIGSVGTFSLGSVTVLTSSAMLGIKKNIRRLSLSKCNSRRTSSKLRTTVYLFR